MIFLQRDDLRELDAKRQGADVKHYHLVNTPNENTRDTRSNQSMHLISLPTTVATRALPGLIHAIS